MRLLLPMGILILNIAATVATIGKLDDILADDSNATYPMFEGYKRSAIRQVVYGLRRFWEVFLKEFINAQSFIDRRRHFVVSPFGVSISLTMAAAGALHDSKYVIEDALILPKDEKLKRVAYQAVIDQFNNHTTMQLRVANSVFAPTDIDFKPEYVASCKRAYRSSVQYVDFNKSAEVIKLINNFFTDETHGYVGPILKEDDITGNMTSLRLVELNTLFLKGTWLQKFTTCSSYGCPLNIPMKFPYTSIPQMWTKQVVRYGEYSKGDASFIELPFVSDDFENNMSMFILLPHGKEALFYLEKYIDEIRVLELRELSNYRTVNIQLPKLHFQTRFGVNESLRRLNMSNLLDWRAGEFQFIAKKTRLFIKTFIQKSYIEINEDGVVATAATGKVLRPTSFYYAPIKELFQKRPEDRVDYNSVRIGSSSMSLAAPWWAETKISNNGKEADAQDKEEVNFFATHPFLLIIATMNNNPVKIFASRVSVFDQ
ncbi:leukocyte elastase inhibitor A-like [Venturia canescens]|uniref:leukocyte elastase inhibitor A-like n=1 Tax=Venturia canescens TaxID=32260 RepID=UPI001C9C5C0E|nr:leukocyte elastase inhibitor A-like [Venturia canescens]